MIDSAATPLWAGAAVALVWATRRTLRYWGEPGGKPFTALLGAFALVALSMVASAVDPGAELIATPILFALTPVLWATFAFEYTGQFDLDAKRRRLLYFPSVYLAVSHVAFRYETSRLTGTPVSAVDVGATYAVVDATRGSARPVVEALFLAQYAGTFYLMGLTVAATVVVVAQFASFDHLDVRTGLLLVLGGTGPWFVKMTADTIVNMSQLDASVTELPVASGFAIAGGVIVVALTRSDPFETTPAAGAIGPELILGDLPEAVVVTDDEGEVVRLNPTARCAFDADRTDVGSPIAALLGHGLEHLRRTSSLDLGAVGGRRHYEPTVSALRNNHGNVVGHAVVLRDVTDREMREQRLEVLNRVLRHNLRNDITTIRGRAELLTTDRVDPAAVERAITETADDLVELGERASEIERMFAVPTGGGRRSTLADLVADTVAEVRADAAVDPDVTVDVPEGIRAGVDDRILRPVIQNVVANAVEHSDRDRPTVRVTARTGEGSLPVVLTVADDGPGLPENERRTIERGREEPLEHASALGLWAIKWGVTRAGGALSIEENEPRGTVVEIRLPRSPPARAEDRPASTPSGRP